MSYRTGENGRGFIPDQYRKRARTPGAARRGHHRHGVSGVMAGSLMTDIRKELLVTVGSGRVDV